MATDLAGRQNDIPERFVPDEMRGQLMEAEHLGRYRWAAQIASGRRVLDAGCGTAYGTAMLARAGATAVTGVDVAASVIDSVRDSMPEAVTLTAGNVRDLPFEDASFDLIVCFEVIEHIEEPGAAFDELARVLAPQGVLLVSSPNRGIYPPGNEHHLHEFKPTELEAELRDRLGNVTLARQHSYVTAAIFDDEKFEGASEEPLSGVDLVKLVADERDRELYTVAVASDGPLPELGNLAMLTGSLALMEWVGHTERLEGEVRAQRRYIAEQSAVLGNYHEMTARLREAEGRYDDARRTIERLEREGREQKHHHDLEVEAISGSLSWRITKPIRDFKDWLAARRG
jgi:2-polyprenyl-3-methyl-5-hydroxy-6-metoxy-1,4-benzoquinol methylase